MLVIVSVWGGSPAQSAESLPQSSITIEDIVEFRDFSGLAVCSNSGLIAVRVDRPSISQNRINHEWSIIEWPSGNIRIAANAGQSLNTKGYRENSHPQWSPDCKWLYYRALHGGEVQVWRLSSESGAQENVTFSDADILDFALIQNGLALVYQTSASRGDILAAEAQEYENGVLINEHISPWHGRLTNTAPILGRWATVRRWNLRTSGHLLSRKAPIYKRLTIRSGDVRSATETEIKNLIKADADWIPRSNFGSLISPTGELAVVVLAKTEETDDVTRGHYLLGYLATTPRINPSEIRRCRDNRCTAEHLVLLKWSDDESSVYFIAEQVRGKAGIYKWTPSTGKVRTIIETGGLLGAFTTGNRQYQSGPCPIIEGMAFCTASEPNNPPRLLATSLNSGQVSTVFDPNADLRNRLDLKIERITWKDDLGRDAMGVLIFPQNFKDGTRYPLIITTYVCRGFLSGGVGDGGPEYALAENGFLVLCIDRNQDYTTFSNDRYSRAEMRYIGSLSEYESAIEMLVKKGLAHRRRVGITGLSMSVQAVSYALTHSTVITVAALRGLGVVENQWGKCFFRSEKEVAYAINRDHGITGTERDINAAYSKLSLTQRAGRVNAPILVQASDSEYLFSLPAFSALHKRKKHIEMIVYPDETHHLHQPVHRYVNFTRNLDWFRFWLQAHEDPDPEKEEQYARWRKMRDERCAWEEPEDKKPTYCEYASRQETVH